MSRPIVKKTIFACALTLCAFTLFVTTAKAQEVVLTATDGSMSLRGELIEFTDQTYTLETLVGTLTVDSAFVDCAGEACPDIVIEPQFSEFSVAGPGTLASNLVADLLPGYAQSLNGQVSKADNPDGTTFTVANTEGEELTKISLANSSSSAGLNNLLLGHNAIALTSRQILSEEAFEFENKGLSIRSPDHEQVIGLDAIAIVTSEDNPINAISIRDAALVFSGAYSNWSELGGSDAPINLYGPQTNSEFTELFIARVIESQGDDLSGLSDDIVTADDVAASVSNDPNGIGYTHFSNSLQAKALAIREICGLAIPVNDFTIKAEEYPLTQRLYAYSISQIGNSHVDDLLQFLQSDAGQAVADSHGLVDQRGTSNSIDNQGTRFVNAINLSDTDASGVLLRDMATQVLDSDRLSTTFRFEIGTNEMDQRAQADIIRLAEKLQSPENLGNVVLLLGFTDSVGDFELNQELSLRRANQVRNALIEIDATLSNRVNIKSSGLGEIAPIACNETTLGRSINRRVEVWIGKPDE